MRLLVHPLPTFLSEEIAPQLAQQIINATSGSVSGVLKVKTESWSSKDGVTHTSEKTESWGGRESHIASYVYGPYPYVVYISLHGAVTNVSMAMS